MNVFIKARISLAAAIVLLASVFMLAICSGTALAAGDINLDSTKSGCTYTVIYYPDKADAGMDVWNMYSGKHKAVTSVKSSNKKVATVKLDQGKKSFSLTVKKAGKTKITYKYKGKKFAIVFKAVKYRNPVASLKVGKKQYASAFSKRPISDLGLSGGKLVVKAASGWTFMSAVAGDFRTGATMRIGNGKKVSADADYIDIAMKHKKTGAIVYITVA